MLTGELGHFHLEWRGNGPAPELPDDLSPGEPELSFAFSGEQSCAARLPKVERGQTGVFLVTCVRCAIGGAVTVSDRHDSPRSVRFPCRKKRSSA